MIEVAQDTRRQLGKNGKWLPNAVILLMAIVSGLLAPVMMTLIPEDRVALVTVALGSIAFLITAIRFPVTLVFAVILYESLLSWREATQLRILGYNRLLFYAVMVGSFSLALFYTLVLRKRKIRMRWVDFALSLYLVTNVCCALASVHREVARPGLTYLLASVLCLYTTRLVAYKDRHVHQILTFLLVFMVFEGLLGGIQYLMRWGVLYVAAESGGDFFARATGTLGNGLGWYLSVGYIIIFNLWLYSSKRSNFWLYALALGVIVIGLLASNTRGSWVDCVIASLLSLIPALRIQKRRVALLLFTVGVSLVIILASGVFRERIVSIWEQIREPGRTTVGFRFYVWRAALNMFQDRLLVGVGQDNFKLLLPDYLDQKAKTFLRIGPDHSYNVHHAGLQILAETGILGALTFVLFILAYLHEGLRLYQRLRISDRGLAMAFWIFAMVSTLSILYGGYAFGGYTQVGRLYFVMVGLTLAQADIIRRGGMTGL